jgi:hypothetical protein
MEIPEYIKHAICVVVIALLAFRYIGRNRVYNPNPNDYELNDIELLERPLIMTGRMLSAMGSDGKLRVTYVDIGEHPLEGREYRLVDSPDDGYFPNDSDRLVDSVSKRDYYYPKGRFLRPVKKWKYRRTRWTYMPFEPELYQTATERYKEALAKINSSIEKEGGTKIGM